jgi:hypothetical protein
VAAGRRGKRGREVLGFDSPLRFQGRRPAGGSHGAGRRPALAGAAAALQVLAAAGATGRRGREARRFFSPPYLGQWRCEEAAPRWPAGLGVCGGGGGAGSSGRGCAVVEVAVVLGGEVEGPL